MIDHERVKSAFYAQEWPCQCGKPSLWRVWDKFKPTHYCRNCYHQAYPNGQFTGLEASRLSEERTK